MKTYHISGPEAMVARGDVRRRRPMGEVGMGDESEGGKVGARQEQECRLPGILGRTPVAGCAQYSISDTEHNMLTCISRY